MRSRIEIVTPKMAVAFLKMAVPNRPISQRYVLALADAIVNEKWKENGDTIKIDENNMLVDGQHRCLAIIKAGKSIKTLVVRDLAADSDMFDSIDTGKKRTISDIFARSGELNYTILGGAVSWFYRYSGGRKVNGFVGAPRHDEARSILETHPKIRQSVVKTHSVKRIMRPSLAAFLHYSFSCKSVGDADRFFKLLASGENISALSPSTSSVYWLRKRLLDDRCAKAKLPVYELAPLCVKAWNCFRGRKVVRILRWNSDEGFPTII